MAIMKVTVNGIPRIVDAPDVRTAKTWGRAQIKTDVEVSDASASDLKDVDFDDIPVLEKTVSKEISEEATTLNSKPASQTGLLNKIVGIGAGSR